VVLDRRIGRAALDAMADLGLIATCVVIKGKNRKLDGDKLASEHGYRDQRDGTTRTGLSPFYSQTNE
jgi:hypothetical protein